jgi:cardiolipin synthase
MVLRKLRKPELRLPASFADAEPGYVHDPSRLRAGNRVQLLIDGEQAFPAMLEAIGAAQRTIHLETYIFEEDSIGRLFGRALRERARAGVTVRVLCDAVGSFLLSESFVAELAEAGCVVMWYRPLRLTRRLSRWSRRDHRKILVVDSTVGFVGGINIGADYAPLDVGGAGWRDTHARVEGPVVGDLEAMFATTWRRARGAAYPPYPRDSDESVAVPESAFAAVLGTDHLGERLPIHRAYAHALGQARSFAYIANAYFLPDRAIRRALTRAAARGVDVRIIVPEKSDVASVLFAGQRIYARLLRRGVRIFEWPQTHMHAKTAVVDGVWSIVGSYNLDYISLLQNLEVVLQIVGRHVGTEMTAMFEADFGRCRELTLARWVERPWWRRCLEWFFFRFKRWL